MAKDAKGHGSDGRGASASGIKKTSTTTYPDSGQTISRVHWGNGSTTEGSPDNSHMQQLLARGQREGAPHEVSGEAHVQSIAAQHGVSTGHLAPGGRFGYNPDAVNSAIASSNRAGRRIGGKEASAIHRLLKGRG